jgi:hypothetical protein
MTSYIPFYTSYLPYDGKNGTRSSKGNGKYNELNIVFSKFDI